MPHNKNLEEIYEESIQACQAIADQSDARYRAESDPHLSHLYRLTAKRYRRNVSRTQKKLADWRKFKPTIRCRPDPPTYEQWLAEQPEDEEEKPFLSIVIPQTFIVVGSRILIALLFLAMSGCLVLDHVCSSYKPESGDRSASTLCRYYH
jgi:hypothetical protein